MVECKCYFYFVTCTRAERGKIHEEDYTGHCGVGADFNHLRSGNRRNAVGKIVVEQGNGGFDGILRGNRGQAGNRFAG